jgi:hypothetical protein
VLGDDISAWRVFPVRITKSETVGGLKKAIKKEMLELVLVVITTIPALV